MSEKIKLAEADEGFQEFEFNGKTVKVDIYNILQKTQEMARRRAEFPHEDGTLEDDMVKYMTELGFDNISKYVAIKFSKCIRDLSLELKKNIE